MAWYEEDDDVNIIKDPKYDPKYHVKEAVITFLRASIIRGNLKPGEFLHESDLQKQFGASRPPIREALVQLAQEGLVKTIPRKGTFITEIDKTSLKQSLFVRSNLESSNIEILVQNIGDEGLSELHANIATQKMFLQGENFPGLYESMDQFHYILFSINGLPKVWELIRREKISLDRLQALNLALDQIRAPKLGHYQRMNTMFEQHVELVNGLEEKDLEKCVAIIRSHANLEFNVIAAANYPTDGADNSDSHDVQGQNS
jgi:DNA-binding GntR family transcriptional regulator